MTALAPNVERWRTLVAGTVDAALAANPTEAGRILSAGLSVNRITDTLLAIVQQESGGDPEAAGDCDAGGCASVGLFQLNFDAGTPQNVGYTGDKISLFDPTSNTYWAVKLFLSNLARYNYSIDYAIISHRYGSTSLDSQTGRPVHAQYLDDVAALVIEQAQDRGELAARSQNAGCVPGAGVAVVLALALWAAILKTCGVL